MKQYFLYSALFFLTACSSGTGENNSSATADNNQAGIEQSDSKIPTSADPNSTVELKKELSKIAPQKDYKTIGEIRVETLTFSSFGMGDMAHIIFTNSKNEELDFAGNITDTQLFLESEEASEENGGYESNPKYVGKKFTVGWRRVQLTKEPTDYMEEFYREFDEIIYLKQLN